MKLVAAHPAHLLLLVVFVLAFVPLTTAQITESPLTVRPGRYLLEIDALSVARDRDEVGGSSTVVAVATTFFTTGITDTLDVQVGADLFLSQKYDRAGLGERNSGIGDLYLRSKWTFWRDDYGRTAVALLPYVKLPSNSGGVGNDSVEGGLIVPWIFTLPGGSHFHAMSEWRQIRNPADNGYDSELFFSGTFEQMLTDFLGLYGEITLAKSFGGEPWEGTAGLGGTFAISESLLVDVGLYRGVTRRAMDWNQVIRVSWRF